MKLTRRQAAAENLQIRRSSCDKRYHTISIPVNNHYNFPASSFTDLPMHFTVLASTEHIIAWCFFSAAHKPLQADSLPFLPRVSQNIENGHEGGWSRWVRPYLDGLVHNAKQRAGKGQVAGP